MLKMKTKSIFLIALTLIFCQNYLFSQDLKPFKTDSIWGYKNSKGIIKIIPQFQYASKFSEKFAVVAQNNLLGAIDSISETVIPFKYEYLKYLKDNKFIFGYRTKYFGEYKLGLINSKNEILIEPVYRIINLRNNILETIKQIDSVTGTTFAGDIRSVKWKYGLHSLSGKEIIPDEFDYINWLDESLIALSKGDFQALFQSNGTKLTDFEFVVIDEFKDNLSKVRKGDKYGFINKQGVLVIPIIFDLADPFEIGYSKIRINKKWGIINTKGEFIYQPKFSFKKMKGKIKTL